MYDIDFFNRYSNFQTHYYLTISSQSNELTEWKNKYFLIQIISVFIIQKHFSFKLNLVIFVPHYPRNKFWDLSKKILWIYTNTKEKKY